MGHFSDNRMIEEAFDIAPKTSGAHDVKVSQPSKVYYPDGTIKTTEYPARDMTFGEYQKLLNQIKWN